MAQLPVNIDGTYADRSPADSAHQKHHDVLHAVNNALDTIPDGQLVGKAAGGLTGVSPASFDAAGAAAAITAPGRFRASPMNINGDLGGIIDQTGHAALIVRENGHITVSLADDSTIPQGLLSNDEVIAARGSRASLDERLDAGLDEYGMERDYLNRAWRTRWVRMLTQRLKFGDVGTQLDIACIGDSYTHNVGRWIGPFATELRETFGDAGVGWVGFGNQGGTYKNGAARTDVSWTATGSWDWSVYYGTRSPDLGEARSTTVGDQIVVTFPAGQASAKLYYGGTVDGQITYKWGTDTAQTLVLDGTGAQVKTLVAPGSAHTTLTITVAAGTVHLFGVDIRNGSNGVRVHKLGATGSNSGQWATAAATADWRAMIASLAPRCLVVLLGTNDQGISTAPSVFASQMSTIFDGANAALNALAFDRVLFMPPENQRGLSVTMASYAAAAIPVADSQDAAYIDSQPLFGVNPADYAYGSPRPWFASDNIHPDPATGGRVLADAALRLVLNR